MKVDKRGAIQAVEAEHRTSLPQLQADDRYCVEVFWVCDDPLLPKKTLAGCGFGDTPAEAQCNARSVVRTRSEAILAHHTDMALGRGRN